MFNFHKYVLLYKHDRYRKIRNKVNTVTVLADTAQTDINSPDCPRSGISRTV